MWSPDRRTLLAGAALLALGGCGYRPALGRRTESRALLGRTRVVTPEGRIGFALGESLRSRLGAGGASADHRLEADLAVSESGLAITSDSAVTRFVLRGTSRWRLTGPQAGEEGLSGTAESSTAYSATASLYATRAAQRDAESRLARDIGERIATTILAQLGTEMS
ncbi:MAG: LPS assembly lipoprotein LptE [Paracoccaceae bacterium]